MSKSATDIFQGAPSFWKFRAVHAERETAYTTIAMSSVSYPPSILWMNDFLKDSRSSSVSDIAYYFTTLKQFVLCFFERGTYVEGTPSFWSIQGVCQTMGQGAGGFFWWVRQLKISPAACRPNYLFPPDINANPVLQAGYDITSAWLW